MKKFLGIASAVVMLTGCTTAQVQSYLQSVANACMVGELLLNSPIDATVASLPAVSTAVNLLHSACDTEQAINTLAQSPVSVAWVNTLITTVKSKGTIVPPPPVENP